MFEALGSMRFPYIYPDPESRRLRAALAQDSGIEADYILAGCGADELIDLIMRFVPYKLLNYVFHYLFWFLFFNFFFLNCFIGTADVC